MYHLDELDMRIMRELDSPNSPRWNVRPSYAEISRKLGIDEETVRLRVKRARERGAFPTWRVMVNPRVLECEAATLEIEVDTEERKAQVVSQLRLLDGVTKIHDYRGKGLQVTVYSPPGEALSRKIRLIEAMCGSAATVHWTSRFPRATLRMTKTDWRIVDALREDAGRDLAEVAASLGTSVRTVQRRLVRMREAKAIFLSGAPNVGAMVGLVCCFVVFCPDRDAKTALDARIRSDFSRVGHIDSSPEQYSVLGMPCENFAEAEKTLGKLKGVRGVQDADMRVMKETILVEDWLKGEISRRIAAP